MHPTGLQTPAPIVPVLITNEPSIVEILSNIVAPALSIALAAIAIWLTVRADRHRKRAEERLAVLAERDSRRSYAERFVLFTRSRRRDALDPMSITHLDDWNDLRHSAPDLQSESLLAWAVTEYNDLDAAHSAAGADGTLARVLLQHDIEERVHLWVLSGFAKTRPPHGGRSDWP